MLEAVAPTKGKLVSPVRSEWGVQRGFFPSGNLSAARQGGLGA